MKPIKIMKRALAGAVAGTLSLGAGISTAQQLDAILNVEQERTEIAQASQSTIDAVSQQTSELLNEYREVQKQIETLRTYNAQIEKLVNAQNREVTSLNKQIDNVTVIDRQISPLMLRMIDSLGEFIRLDVPFLAQERENRIEQLRTMMDRADVANSEKFRRLLEAFQIENEYGRTIEAYRGQLQTASGSREVDYLRVGRVILLYQTLDRSETGMWDQTNKIWVTLPDTYRSPVRQGLRMARKQVAPDLLRLPIPAPEVAQ